MKAPKCLHCGKEEWRHLCSGASAPQIGRRVGGERVPTAEPVALAVVVDHAAILLEQASVLATIPVRDEPAPKSDRKEYMRLLMADKRAALKLGITLAEYRKRKGGG